LLNTSKGLINKEMDWFLLNNSPNKQLNN